MNQPLDSPLPDDQEAILALLVREDRTYDEVGAMLGVDAEAVRDRAHLAVASLAGDRRAMLWDDAGDLSDYVLGQQSPEERATTRRLLRKSTDDRQWVEQVADELRVWDESPPPPCGPTAIAAVPHGMRPRRDMRKLLVPGLAIFLAGVVAVTALGGPGSVILRLASASGALPGTPPDGAVPTDGTVPEGAMPEGAVPEGVPEGAVPEGVPEGAVPEGVPEGAVPEGTETAPSGVAPSEGGTAAVTPEGEAELRPPDGQGDAEGTLTFVRAQGVQVLALEATELGATSGSRSYVLWIEPNRGDPVALGVLPDVASDGRLQVQAQMGEAIAPDRIRTAFITSESISDGQQRLNNPGTRVLSGSFVAS